MTERLTPASFGYRDPDDWQEPDDGLLDWLASDRRVDPSNRDIRRGARDEMAGKGRSANPFQPERTEGDLLSGLMGARGKAWLEGWKASGNHHGRFDRHADDRAHAEIARYVRDTPPDFNPLRPGNRD